MGTGLYNRPSFSPPFLIKFVSFVPSPRKECVESSVPSVSRTPFLLCLDESGPTKLLSNESSQLHRRTGSVRKCEASETSTGPRRAFPTSFISRLFHSMEGPGSVPTGPGAFSGKALHESCLSWVGPVLCGDSKGQTPLRGSPGTVVVFSVR